MMNAAASAQFAGFQFLEFENNSENVEKLYFAILDWYKQLGVSPDIVAIGAPGHSGKYVSFKSAHAKLKKSGFDGVTAFELNVEGPKTYYESNWDWSINTSYYSGGVTPHMTIRAKYPYGQLSADSLLVPAKAVIEAIHPEYGIGYTGETIGRVNDDIAAVAMGHNEILSGWSNFGETARAWRIGQIEAVRPWNFLNETLLSAPLEGRTLREWIQADPSRGAIEKMSKNLFLWSLDSDNCSKVFTTLWQNGLIFNGKKYLDGRLAQQQAQNEQEPEIIAPRKIEDYENRLAHRDKLIEKVRRLSKQGPDCYVLAVVDLEDFFDGNWDESSLAPNMMDYGRPPLHECCQILRSIRDRADVQDVLIAIRRTPEQGKERDAYQWPNSDTVYILTSCDLREVKQWTEDLKSDETNDMGKRWLTTSSEKPAGAPDLLHGMKVFALWWD